MADANSKKTPADFVDWSNPGPARPGKAIHAKQAHKRQISLCFRLAGSLMSERQQEIYFYVLFVLTFSVAWFIDRPGQQSFMLAKHVEEHFLKHSFRPDLTSQDSDYQKSVAWPDVISLEELWGWMEGPLLAAAYDEDTPRSGVGNVLGYNGFCNGLRVRQVRVKPTPCTNMLENDALFFATRTIMQDGGFKGECYPEVSGLYGILSNEDTATFGPNASSSIFNWQATGNKHKQSMTTSFGTYSEDGYMFELPSFNKTKARDIIKFHRANRFFDVQTRAVFIDATLYNPSMERFVVMRLLAEVPQFGGVQTTSSFFAIRVTNYTGVFGLVQIVLEGVWVLQLCAFVFWEIMKLRKLGIEYIKQFWGILVLIKGVLMLCLVGFRVTTFQSLETQRQDWDKAIMANQNEYIDMQHIPDIISLDNNVMAIMSLLIYLRLFKFAADTKKIEHLYTVIFKSMAEILPFLVLFLIIYIGFTLAFYSCFGLRVYEYRNLEQSLRSNIAILAGDAAFYPDLLVANKYMAPLLYYFMLLVHYVLLLNMFNAIVVQNMAIVKAGLEKDTDVVFKESFNNFLDRFKKAPKKAAKNNKIGAVSSPSKVSAPLERVASVSKDSLFERAPSGTSAVSRVMSGLGRTSSAADANPSSRPTSGKSQKSGRWDSVRNIMRTTSGASKAGSEMGDDDGPMTARSGGLTARSFKSKAGGGGGGGVDSAALADLEEQMVEIKRHVMVVDDVKMQLMGVSDRLNALTEYLVSDTSASKSTRQFQTLNRKLDMLAEALVATEIQGRMAQAGNDPSLSMSEILGTGAQTPPPGTLTDLEAAQAQQEYFRKSDTAGALHKNNGNNAGRAAKPEQSMSGPGQAHHLKHAQPIPGWTD